MLAMCETGVRTNGCNGDMMPWQGAAVAIGSRVVTGVAHRVARSAPGIARNATRMEP